MTCVPVFFLPPAGVAGGSCPPLLRIFKVSPPDCYNVKVLCWAILGEIRPKSGKVPPHILTPRKNTGDHEPKKWTALVEHTSGITTQQSPGISPWPSTPVSVTAIMKKFFENRKSWNWELEAKNWYTASLWEYENIVLTCICWFSFFHCIFVKKWSDSI